VAGAKTVLVFMLVGAVIGAVAASFVVPPVLSWYNATGTIAPSGHVETLCDLPEMIRYTARSLFRGQLIGAGIGAVLFFFPGIATVRRRAAAVPAVGQPSSNPAV